MLLLQFLAHTIQMPHQMCKSPLLCVVLGTLMGFYCSVTVLQSGVRGRDTLQDMFVMILKVVRLLVDQVFTNVLTIS